MKRKMKKYVEGGKITDEERYGRVGAEIRRLDPEAYKNRTDKSAAANMKLLKELREKKKDSSSRKMSTEEFMEGTKKRGFNVSSPKRAESDTPARKMSIDEFMRGTKKRGFDVSAPRRTESDTPARRMSADEFVGGMKRGGTVKSSASRRADGIAQRGKTRGKFV